MDKEALKAKAKAEKEKAKAKAEKEKAKAKEKAEKEKAKAKKSKMKENLDDGEITDVEGDLRKKGEIDSKLKPYQPIGFK